jgi:hypothetical protein
MATHSGSAQHRGTQTVLTMNKKVFVLCVVPGMGQNMTDTTGTYLETMS